MAKKILYVAVDMDGCFMGPSFARDPNRDIVAANQQLFDKLVSKKSKYDKVVLTLGSNRQSIPMDFDNSKQEQVGSAFYQLKVLAKQLKKRGLKAKADNALLADLFNDQEAGHSFKLAKALYEPDGKTYKQDVRDKLNQFPGWIEDTSKVSILYAQMQRASLKNPKEEITFKFYDDKPEIRNALQAFFTKHPHLIPSNVKLKIRGYESPVKPNGDAVDVLIIKEGYETIQGTGGLANKKYAEVVKQMTAAVILSEEAQDREPLSNFKSIPILSYEDAQTAGFHVTGTINCSKYYIPEAPTKSSSSSSSSVMKNLSSFFKGKEKKKKSEDKGLTKSVPVTSESKGKEKDEDQSPYKI